MQGLCTGVRSEAVLMVAMPAVPGTLAGTYRHSEARALPHAHSKGHADMSGTQGQAHTLHHRDSQHTP